MFNREKMIKFNIGLSLTLLIIYDLMIMFGSNTYFNDLKIYPEAYIYPSILLLSVFGVLASKKVHYKIINICMGLSYNRDTKKKP